MTIRAREELAGVHQCGPCRCSWSRDCTRPDAWGHIERRQAARLGLRKPHSYIYWAPVPSCRSRALKAPMRPRPLRGRVGQHRRAQKGIKPRSLLGSALAEGARQCRSPAARRRHRPDQGRVAGPPGRGTSPSPMPPAARCSPDSAGSTADLGDRDQPFHRPANALVPHSIDIVTGTFAHDLVNDHKIGLTTPLSECGCCPERAYSPAFPGACRGYGPDLVKPRLAGSK